MRLSNRTGRGIAVLATVLTVIASSPIRAADAAADTSDTVRLSDLPRGHAPRADHLIGTTVLRPDGSRVRVRLPRGYGEATLIGRHRGEFVVRAYTEDGDLPDQFGLFGVTKKRTRLITTYSNGRELFSPYLVPGNDHLYLVSDGADSYNPLSFQVSLKSGKDVGPSFRTTSERSPVLGVDAHGVLFEVHDRIVQWGPRGGRTILLDDRDHADERSLLAVFVDADLVAFELTNGEVTWRRLSDPTIEVWRSATTPDDPRFDPLDLSPDLSRIVTREGTALVVRRTSDGHVVSSVRLVDDAKHRPAHLGAVTWEDERTFLVEVERSARLHAGMLRCTVAGRCMYALPRDVDARLSWF